MKSWQKGAVFGIIVAIILSTLYFLEFPFKNPLYFPFVLGFLVGSLLLGESFFAILVEFILIGLIYSTFFTLVFDFFEKRKQKKLGIWKKSVSKFLKIIILGTVVVVILLAIKPSRKVNSSESEIIILNAIQCKLRGYSWVFSSSWNCNPESSPIRIFCYKCNVKTSDYGKNCNSKEDCEGECMADSRACSEYVNVLDFHMATCPAILRDGKRYLSCE